MKRNTKLFLSKSIDSLTLSVEMFNRPHDVGRKTTTVILLDHAFEMLLKAAILHRGGRIRKKQDTGTISFDTSVRIGLSDGKIKFLTEEQVLTLQLINNLRNVAQHDIFDISEGQLYMHAQSGLTLFGDILLAVFNRKLSLELPDRVLPLATQVPSDIQTLFATEVGEIRKVLRPGTRQQTKAIARLRPLAILEFAMHGKKGQPSQSTLSKLKQDVAKGKHWEYIFPGVASIQTTAEGTGPNVEIRLTKKLGLPVHLVPEGTPGASVIAVKSVDALGFYTMGLKDLAGKLGMTAPKVLAVIKELNIQKDKEYFNAFKIGKASHKRYSVKALKKIKSELPNLDMGEVWRKNRPKGQKRNSR